MDIWAILPIQEAHIFFFPNRHAKKKPTSPEEPEPFLQKLEPYQADPLVNLWPIFFFGLWKYSVLNIHRSMSTTTEKQIWPHGQKLPK